MMTLARSVSQLSAEIKSTHELAQEVENVRRDCDWIHEQLRYVRTAQINGMSSSLNYKHHHQSTGHISSSGREWDKPKRESVHQQHINPGKIEKLTR